MDKQWRDLHLSTPFPSSLCTLIPLNHVTYRLEAPHPTKALESSQSIERRFKSATSRSWYLVFCLFQTWTFEDMPQADSPFVPTHEISSVIFSTATERLTPTDCQVLSNTWTVCTFRCRDEVIRMDCGDKNLLVVAAMQRLGQLQLPNLVPPILHSGSSPLADDNKLTWFSCAFIEGIDLERVWNSLSDVEQGEITKLIIDAMITLQTLDINTFRNELLQIPTLAPIASDKDTEASPPYRKVCVGNSSLGWFSDIKKLLQALAEKRGKWSPGCKVIESSELLSVASDFPDLGSIGFTVADLADLEDTAVFCHNDLEPRNIIVRRIKEEGFGHRRFELAAIIDWELAGFVPFAYELGFKDSSLGSSNQWYSWYFQFKRLSRPLLPAGKAHDKFIRAMRIIDESRKRGMSRVVSVRVQIKWLERQRCIFSEDPRNGWARAPDTGPMIPWLKKDRESLELEVLKELGRA